MGLYLALLYPFHTTGRKFLSSLFWFFGWFFLFCFGFFLVYWKTKNISLHFYLPACFSEPSDCMISDNREIYDVMSQKTTADSLESVSQPRARGHAASMLGCRRWPRDRCRASTLRDVWFYCEVNCMNIVTKEKKSLPEIDTTLSSPKAAGRSWEASRAGLSCHTTLTWAAPHETGAGVPCDMLSCAWLYLLFF